MIDTNANKKGTGLPGVVMSTRGAFRQFVTDSFLQVKTDEKGIAHFRNIPSLSESFEVESPGYVMAAYPTSKPKTPVDTDWRRIFAPA